MVFQKGHHSKHHRKTTKKTAPLQTYIKRVAKHAAPGLTLSSASLRIVNSFVMDMYNRLAIEATSLMRSSGKQTLTSRDLQAAVRLILPDDLAKYSMSEAVRAVGKLSA